MDIAVIIRDAAQPDDARQGLVALKKDKKWSWRRTVADDIALELFFSAEPPEGLSCGWTSYHGGWTAWVAEHTTLLELRRALSLPRETPDAKTMRAAIERWGFEAVHQTYSVWAGAIWNQNEKILHFFRDRIGLVPAFHFKTPAKRSNIEIFSTSMALVQQVCPEARKVNVERLRAYLLATKTFRRDDFFAGVNRLHPGECWTLRLDNERAARGFEENHYWVPSEPLLPSVEQGKQQVYSELELVEIFSRVCADYLAAGYRPFVSVSGGMDSSFMLALMVKQARAHGFISDQIVAATMGFPSAPSVDERTWTNLLAKYLRMSIDIVDVDDRWPLRDPTVYTSNPELGPLFHPNADYSDAFVRRALVGYQRSSCFSGTGADYLFLKHDAKVIRSIATQPFNLKQFVQTVNTFGITRSARIYLRSTLVGSMWRIGRSYLTPMRASGTNLFLWWRPEVWVNGEETLQSDSMQRYKGRCDYLASTTWDLVSRGLRRKGCLYGISYHLPFMRRDFVEGVFSAEAHLKVGFGRHRKNLLRQLARYHVPEAIRLRPKGGLFSQVVDKGLGIRELDKLLQLFGDNSVLASKDLIDIERFKEVLREYGEFCSNNEATYKPAGAMSLWRTISAELWLRRLRD